MCSVVTTRTRVLPHRQARGITWTSQKRAHGTNLVSDLVPADILSEPPRYPTIRQGSQVTVSENHPGWRNLHASTGDVGGAFTTKRTYASYSVEPMDVILYTPWQNRGSFDVRSRYDGPIYVEIPCLNASQQGFPDTNQSSDAALNALGATAVARCAPSRPTVSLAASLLEAWHDGLPHLIGRETWASRISDARDLARSGSSEFLNVQFGWLPLISDVLAFTKTVIHLDKLIKQYISDNGQVVRRTYYFPPESTITDQIVCPSAYPGLGTNGGRCLDSSPAIMGQIARHREVRKQVWFSGGFVYHLGRSFFSSLYSPFASEFQAKSHLFGLELTPDVLWEITPWSWAVDWFSNVGDVIHNASAWLQDGLVMKYGYIMEHTYAADTYTYVGPTNLNDPSVTARPTPLNLVCETKVRRVANPFGFGLSMSGLSTLQKAILAAVGLSRLR